MKTAFVKKLVVIDSDDWDGLWVNDRLVYQDHTVEVSDIEQAAGGEPFTLEHIDVNTEEYEGLLEWLYQNGQFDESDTVAQALAHTADEE